AESNRNDAPRFGEHYNPERSEMNIHINAPSAARAALALSMALPLIVACGDDTTLGRVSVPAADARLDRDHVKMPKELWVTSQGGNVLFIRNFEDLSPIDQIDLPAGAGPHIITFHTPDFAYVGGMTDGNVYVIDANARRVVQTMNVAPTLAH